MEPPGRCGDWSASPQSPPSAHAPGLHDERGVGTSIWPPAGTYTWPSARTLSWPWTDVGVRVGEFACQRVDEVAHRSGTMLLGQLRGDLPDGGGRSRGVPRVR